MIMPELEAETEAAAGNTTMAVDVLVKLDNARTYLLSVVADSSPPPGTKDRGTGPHSDAGRDCDERRGGDDSNFASAVIRSLSVACGLPSFALRPVGDWSSENVPTATPTSVPFLSAASHLPILGGKGGFGTLLKGQSKMAGAKTTLDFGACRDLSGRRLRHVNDEVKLRKWRDAQRRRAAGLPVDELGELKTPSGIRNWHLMVPSWSEGAAVSNKGKRKNEIKMRREVERWMSVEERARVREQRRKDEHDRSVAAYVRAGVSAEEEDDGGGSKKDLILRAMRKKRAAAASASASGEAKKPAAASAPPAEGSVKRKFGDIGDTECDDEEGSATKDDVDDGTPSFLCVLSGDAAVFDVKTSPSSSASGSGSASVMKKLAIQSQSEFATIAVLLDRPDPRVAAAPTSSENGGGSSGTMRGMYYEVTVRSGGLAQIGWALAGPSSESGGAATSSVRFAPNSDVGDGVGDDAASWGYDGERCLKFHAGKEEPHGGGGTESKPWREGDVLGCAHLPSSSLSGGGEVRYYLNGKELGSSSSGGAPAFSLIPGAGRLTPAISLNGGEDVHLNVGPAFEFDVPGGCGGACEWLDLEENEEGSDKSEDAVAEVSGAKNTKEGAASVAEEAKQLVSPPCQEEESKKSSERSNSDVAEAPKPEETAASAADKSATAPSESNEPPSPPPFDPSSFDLDACQSPSQLEELGLDSLRALSAHMGLKAGGALSERAARIWSVRGVKREVWPKKVRGKGFVS